MKKKIFSFSVAVLLTFCFILCATAPNGNGLESPLTADSSAVNTEESLPVVYAGAAKPLAAAVAEPVLTGGSWYTENMFNNDAIEASVSHTADSSTVTLKANAYSLTRIVSHVGEVKSNNYYEIKVPIEKLSTETDIDILEIWYDASGKELMRQYVDDDRYSLSPEGAAKLDVYVLIRGWNTDTVKVSLPKVTEKSPYTKREAKIAAVTINQYSHGSGKRTMQHNLNDAIAKIDELCANPADKPDIILFTERFHTMGVSFANFAESYLTLDGPYIQSLKNKAAEYEIYLCFSFREKDAAGNVYNSSPLIDREGNVVANYHKTHLTMGELARGIVPGKELMYYDTDFGRVGFAICWDLFFNNCVDEYSKLGVDLILNPSLGYWDDINSMRAEDSGAYILTAGSGNASTSILRPEGNYDPEKSRDYGNIITRGDRDGNNGTVVATVDFNQRFLVKYLSAPSTAERPNVYEHESRPDLYEKYK